MRKGYALALLAVFALVLGGAGCCQKYYDQCAMYSQQAKASADRAAASAVKAEAAAQDAKVPVPRASAAANKAEAAAARAEDAAAKVCAMVGIGKVYKRQKGQKTCSEMPAGQTEKSQNHYHCNTQLLKLSGVNPEVPQIQKVWLELRLTTPSVFWGLDRSGFPAFRVSSPR